MQFTLQTAETNILESIPEIASVDAVFPNLLYAEYDYSKFGGLTRDPGNRKIYVPVMQPSSLVAAEMIRGGDETAATVNGNGAANGNGSHGSRANWNGVVLSFLDQYQ